MATGRYGETERIGVNAVEGIVLKELGWIFREQLIADMGIDAHIEKVDAGSPTGKLVALQIKTGPSHLHETKEEFTYYGDPVHLDYWTGHSLPVILVVHLPASSQTYWEFVSETNVQRTNKGWKITIPKSNIFGRKTIDSLAAIFEGSPAQQRFRKLTIDEPLMRHIKNGGKVSASFQDWVNKSLGRTPVKVFVHDEDGNETLSKESFHLYTGYSIKALAEALFPWANVMVDLDFYDLHNDFEEDWRHRLCRDVDGDDVYPYKANGEVEFYRLALTLNDLGKAFLIVSAHLGKSERTGRS